jgi:hypothetical protein
MHIKPIVSYVAHNLISLIPQLNVPIVRKKESKDNYRNWINKVELTDYVDALYKPPASDCYIYIKCKCGVEYEYTNKQTVPDKNVICKCGRKVVEYGIFDNNEKIDKNNLAMIL